MLQPWIEHFFPQAQLSLAGTFITDASLWAMHVAMHLLFQQTCSVYKCNQRSVLTHSVVLLQQDSYLQALVRAVQHTDANLQIPAVQILACLIAQDPSTHYVCAEVGTTTQADVACVYCSCVNLYDRPMRTLCEL